MKNNLDELKVYKQLDARQCINDIYNLQDQIALAWIEAQKVVIPSYYLKAKNISLAGMGASGIGGAIARSLALSQCRVPVAIYADYNPPKYINSDTLVIGVSYSGNTEETLSFLEQAQKKGAKCLAIGKGGKIEKLAKKYSFPFFQIKYIAAEPRLSFGSQFTTLVAILSKLGFLDIGENEIKKTINIINNLQNNYLPTVPCVKNEAKKMAGRLLGKIPIVLGAGYLSEVCRKVKGQFNENSKTAAYWEELPEMNHNSLIGTKFPKKLGEKITILILQSAYDHPRTVIRQNLIQNIYKKAKIKYELIGGFKIANPFCEIMQIVLFTDYMTYYLGILNGADPADNREVNYLKDELAKHK